MTEFPGNGTDASGEDVSQLRGQIEDLRAALDAIRSGGVDAVVMTGPEGERIYALTSADRPYRVIVEEMGEGAATVSPRGIVLYTNQRLADLLGCDRGDLLGRNITELASPADRTVLVGLLHVEHGATLRAEIDLECADGSTVPVLAAVTGLDIEGIVVRCLVATDLSEHRRAEREIAEKNAALTRNATELQEAQRVAHVGSWVWDRASDRIVLSPEMFSIFMVDPAVEPLTFHQVLAARASPDDGGLMAARDRVLRDRGAFEVAYQVLLPDGTRRHLLARGESLVDETGAVNGMRGTVQDVTVLTQAQDAVDRSTAKFVAAFERAPVGMALVSFDRTILHANQALSDMARLPVDQLVGMSLDMLVQPHDAKAEEERFLGLQSGHNEGYTSEGRLLTADGELRWVSMQVALVGDENYSNDAVVHLKDISDRKHYETELRYLADHDPLTGLLNRRGFRDMLEHHNALDARYATGGAVVLLDLDNFKDINDTLGHPAGDALLRSIGQAMRLRVRESDVLARLGGDEFAVLLWTVDAAGATRLTQDLLTAVRAGGLDWRHRAMRSTASAGVVLLSGAPGPVDEILANADLAMYAAKKAGGDRAVLHDPARPAAVRSRARFIWLDRVRRALDKDLLELVAQPVLHLASGEITGCELLLRLREGDCLITPDHFLTVAQGHGLALAIDRFVVLKGIQIAAGQPLPSGFRWEINLSIDSLDDPSLPEFIEAELAARKVCPRSMIFEVAETAAIANMDQARAFAGRITRLGCCFAIDDFGRGYGSFYYLKHFPLDYLKIDGEFISDLRTSHANRVIVQSIVAAAHQLGLRTVAESVQDPETVELLRGYQVDYAQGFHIGRPTDPVALLATVRARGARGGSPGDGLARDGSRPGP